MQATVIPSLSKSGFIYFSWRKSWHPNNPRKAFQDRRRNPSDPENKWNINNLIMQDRIESEPENFDRPVPGRPSREGLKRLDSTGYSAVRSNDRSKKCVISLPRMWQITQSRGIDSVAFCSSRFARHRTMKVPNDRNGGRVAEYIDVARRARVWAHLPLPGLADVQRPGFTFGNLLFCQTRFFYQAGLRSCKGGIPTPFILQSAI